MRNSHFRRLAVLAAAASFVTLGACDALSGLTGGGDAAAPAGETAKGAAAGAGAGAPAAPASNLDALLAAPAIGDVWAADLDHFSAATFNTEGRAFGLVKVVAVTDTQVTIITEMGAYPEQAGAITDLASDMSSITWDESERIPVNRADFAALMEGGRIIRTRRMGAGGAASTAGANGGDYQAGGGGGAAPAAPGAPAAPAPAAPGGGK